MTGSDQNCLWHPLTVTLDISETGQLAATIGATPIQLLRLSFFDKLYVELQRRSNFSLAAGLHSSLQGNLPDIKGTLGIRILLPGRRAELIYDFGCYNNW